MTSTEELLARRERLLGPGNPLFFLARAFTYVGWAHTRHETETAPELTPMLITEACELTENYLSNF